MHLLAVLQLDGAAVPAFFAQDLLQRCPAGTLYRDSWPSLFVGPAGSGAELHIDAFGSHFWMGIFSGRKRWRLFPAEMAAALRPTLPHHSLDPTFAADPWRAGGGWDVTIGPGDASTHHCLTL